MHERDVYLAVAGVELLAGEHAVVDVPIVELVVAALPLALKALLDVLGQFEDLLF